ncbi:MAG: OmpA family protein [Rubricella sp.]
MKTPILAVAGAALVLAGCTDPNQPMTRQQQGAIAGAVAGAVLGAATSDNERRGAAIGAVVGGLAGAGIGTYLDRQAEELSGNLEGSGIEIENTGEELILTAADGTTPGVRFAFDSAIVEPRFRSELATIADTLLRYPETVIEITGHTDSTGDASYNQRLSERRAVAVADVLSANGVPASRMRVFGAGESQPVATNETESGRSLNRRVELVIIPRA